MLKLQVQVLAFVGPELLTVVLTQLVHAGIVVLSHSNARSLELVFQVCLLPIVPFLLLKCLRFLLTNFQLEFFYSLLF